MKKIVSFGDSFIFGSELADNDNGSKAWPGLIAKELECEYETLAIPGCGNDSIAQQVYNYFLKNGTTNLLVVINWTWSMRWDFHLPDLNLWINLGPTCVPSKIKDYVGVDEANRLINFYKDYVNNNTVWNYYRNLQTIYAVQSFLKEKNIKAIQTYIEHDLFFPNLQRSRLDHYYAIKDTSWPDISTEADVSSLPDHIKHEVDENYYNDQSADYIKLLRERTLKPMVYFDGDTLLDWSRKNNFIITPPPGNHPLEEAHNAAKLLWLKTYANALDINL